MVRALIGSSVSLSLTGETLTVKLRVTMLLEPCPSFTVTVNDGQGSNNIVTRSFTVSVSPVNDKLTLDPINALTINEDDLEQAITLSGIGAGAGEDQTLTVAAFS